MNDRKKREKRPYISALFVCNKDFLYGRCGLELRTLQRLPCAWNMNIYTTFDLGYMC